MLLRLFIIASLLLIFTGNAATQTTQVKWLLELDAEANPVGKPDEAGFHFTKNGQLYRMSVDGAVQELAYDEATYLGGPELVPMSANSTELSRRYRALNGSAEIVVIKGLAHGGNELYESDPLLKFLLAE